MTDLIATSRIALKRYIDNARKLSIYGGEAGWSANHWITTTLRNQVHMAFCQLRKHPKEPFVVLESPFLEFAKAYVRHKQHQREVGSIGSTMVALRFIYAGLIDVHGKPDVLLIDGAVQESVRERVGAWYESGAVSLAKTGQALMAVYTELREREICSALPVWQSPWKFKPNHSRSMNPKAVAWREEKTPDDAKLAAVLLAFELAEDESDQYWSSLALLLAFAPSRGGELIDLSIDSLIDETYTDKYGRIQRRVGLRWYSEKGFDSNVKWVPRLPTSNGDETLETELMNMVVRAFNRLTKLSETARNAAKLAYDTEGTVYPIHEFCITPADYSQDIVLSDVQAAHAMGRTSILNRRLNEFSPAYRTQKKYVSWHLPCLERGRPTYRDIAQADYNRFAGKLHYWPFTSNSERVKVWECLVLHQWNQFSGHTNKTAYPNSYCLPTTDKLCIQLGGKWVKGEQTQTSLFHRLGLTMEDGSPIKMTSHDFRRWHGTRGRALAHMGLSEHRLRMLAGRKDARQNDAYDFNSPEQKARQFREIVAASRDKQSLNVRLEVGDAIYRHELLNRPLGEHEVPQPVQISEFGGCTHSITEPPCMKGGDCLTCSEKKYIKGTPGCLERLKETAAHHRVEFDALEEHQKKWEQMGVDQWMTYHAIRYAVAECLVRQMEDPSIPDGTVLGLDERFDPSPLKVNLMAKGIEVPNEPLDPVAHEISQLLGPVDA